MTAKGIYKLCLEDCTFIEHNLIIAKEDKILIFEEFEIELLRLFNGCDTLEQILIILSQKYMSTFKQQEFLDFVSDMIKKGVIISCE